MPTSSRGLTAGASAATIRSIRFAVGTALAVLIANAFAWPLSFIMPLFVAMILTTPLPPLGLAGSAKLVVAIVASLGFGLMLFPLVQNQPLAGVLILFLALYGVAYAGAKGAPAMIVTLLTMGITVMPVAAMTSLDLAILVLVGIGVGTVVATLVIALAHFLIPDPSGPPIVPPPPPSRPDAEARRLAIRATVITYPILLFMLASPAALSYIPVLIKTAQMAQQATEEDSRTFGRGQMLSTAIGGLLAVVFWHVLKVWPSLTLYTLITLLMCLYCSSKIFRGPAVAPTAQVWSYAVVTMLLLIGPAVGDTQFGDGAGTAFVERLILFGVAVLYGAVAIYVYDKLTGARERRGDPGH